jgi:5-methylcytosine-specific restriction endonuclease McrA
LKHCPTCQIEKPVEDYYKDSRTKDGLYSACKKCHNARSRSWQTRNVDKVRADQAKYLELHGDHLRAWLANWRVENRDKRRAQLQEWRRANPELARQAKHRRRTREVNGGIYQIADKHLRRLYSQPCFYCGSKDQITADHVIPLARGGTHSLGNLVAACRSCNSQKHAKTITEWKKMRKVAS